MPPSDTDQALIYDPYSMEIGYNPHPLFRRLRDEAPVYHNDEHNFFALSRFEDVERAHVDRETFISSRGVTLDLLKAGVEFPPGTLIFEDPPTHTIHRSLLSRMFTPRKVSALEPQIRGMCAELLDPLIGTGHFDFATDLGSIMPTRVVGMLIGIPEDKSESVRDHFDAFRRDTSETRHDVFSGEIFAEYIGWPVSATWRSGIGSASPAGCASCRPSSLRSCARRSGGADRIRSRRNPGRSANACARHRTVS